MGNCFRRGITFNLIKVNYRNSTATVTLEELGMNVLYCFYKTSCDAKILSTEDPPLGCKKKTKFKIGLNFP